MSDEKPYTAVGDEALEARIVAWVLGEASAFEAEELEKLCEEREELAVFRRRMERMHGLMEAEAVEGADEAWKLSEGKRRPVEDLLPQGEELERERSVRRSGRRAMLAIAACAVVSLFGVWMMPRGYEGKVVLEVRPRAGGMSPLGEGMTDDSEGGTAQFFGTEFEKIKSRESLEKVVENLDLDARWGVEKEEALGKLRKIVDARNLEGTDLIEIKVRDGDMGEAKEIAEEVAETYAAYRRESETEASRRSLEELKKAIRDQEEKVEERRKVLGTIARTKGVIYKGEDTFYGRGGEGEQREETVKRGLDAQDYVDAKRAFETDVALLQEMKVKQMADSISPEMPAGNAVIVHDSSVEERSWFKLPFGGKSEKAVAEAPVIANFSAAEAEEAGNREGMVALETELPPELIEGTPKPMNVPGLVDAKDGPVIAGRTRFGRPEAKRQGERSELSSELDVTGRANWSGSVDFSDGVTFGDAAGVTAGGPVSGRSAGKPSSSSELSGGGADAGRVDAETRYFFSAADGGVKAAPEPATQSIARTAAVRESVVTGAEVAADESAASSDPFAAADEVVPGQNVDAFAASDVPEVADAPVLGRLFKSKGKGGKPETNGRGGEKERAIGLSEASVLGNQKRVDDVKKGLDLADENLKFGELDEAKRRRDDALGVDPRRQAAERGLEELAKRDSDSSGAVYDSERAELLAEVDAAWQLAVPVDGEQDASRKSALGYSTSTWGMDVQGQVKDVELPVLPASPEVVEFDGFIDYGAPIRGLSGKDADGDAFGVEAELEDQPAVVPERKPLLMEEEIVAVEEPYSTFSLNISDASFQVAQAALARGEQPDPAGIKVEQFYNAVDYGDPGPAGGEPVAVTIEQAAHPVVPGRNLVRVAVKTAAAGRGEGQALRLTLLVDQSGSMAREDRRAAMDKALGGLAELLTEKDRVSVIGFSRRARLLAEGMGGELAGGLAELLNLGAAEGGTNLEAALALAEQVALRGMLEGAQNRIVLFTDGAANLGDADPERLAEKVKELRQKGLALDIAGIAADDLNDELLGGLARNGNGRYHVVGKGGEADLAEKLAGAFRPAAENVKVQVRFNPERVGRYRLIGFEEDRLRKEDFRNDAVDAAEMAAEEAGVAIYQVEPLAEGSGEIGEVSVRFRATASGDMVERSWTVPYDEAAPSIGRASPSMQLAALAMLAGEKLRGGAMGGAVDFGDLAEAVAGVREHYGDSGRVAELLKMVEKLGK